jgi:hypothetical protein
MRRNIARRIVDLVEQLLGAGRNVHPAAIDVELADGHASVGIDICKRITERGPILHVFFPGSAKQPPLTWAEHSGR